MKNPRISAWQLSLMLAGSALMFPYTFLPVLRTGPANQDAWIVMLLSLVFIVILDVPLLILVNKFKNFNLVEINELIMGKAAGKASSIIFVIFTLLCYTVCMQVTVLYTRIFLLPETPEWIILLFLLIPAIYIATKGAGTIARLALFIVPFIILTIFAFFVVGIKDMDINNILPVLIDSEPLKIIEGAFLTAARFSEILILVVFSIYLRKNHSVNNAYFKGLMVFGISFLFLVVPTLLLLGSGLAKLTHAPFLIYTRQVGGQDLLQRVQVFNSLAWFMGTLLKLSVYGYIASFLLYRIVNKKSQKFFVYPLSILAFIINMLPIMQKMRTIDAFKQDTIFPFIVLAVIVGVPVLLLIVYLFRMKDVNKVVDERNKSVAEIQAADQPEQSEANNNETANNSPATNNKNAPKQA